MNRPLWILGLLLLVGTLLGAALALQTPTPNGHSTSTASAQTLNGDAPPLVMAIGHVDGKAGVSRLHPLQPGRVTEVLAENTRVKKGDPVLTLDSELAELKVSEARHDVENADAQLAQSDKLKAQQALKIEQQKAALAAVQRKRQSAELERLAKEKTASSAGVDVNPNLLQAMQQLVEHLDELIKVEDAKLRELGLHDPELEMRRAKANKAAKKVQLEQAEWARDQCRLLAPADGLVLRTHVNPGEILGPNPTRPAVEFLPEGPLIVRAEILQEWAPRVKVGQLADIVDDTYLGPSWKGKITSLAPWFAQKRNLIVEPFMYNDVRYMECLVEVIDAADALRVGQRVRVKIKAP